MTDDSKIPLTIELSAEGKRALQALSDTIEQMRPDPKSKTDMSTGARKVFTDMIAELLAATQTPIEWTRAQDLVCAMKSGQKHSINGSSILPYATNSCQGRSWSGAMKRDINNYTFEFQELNKDLKYLIKEHGFDYERFEEGQKENRWQQHLKPTGAEKVTGDKQRVKNARTYTRQETEQTVNDAIRRYKELRNHNVPQDDEGLGYFRQVKAACALLNDPAGSVEVENTIRELAQTAGAKDQMQGLLDRFAKGANKASTNNIT